MGTPRTDITQEVIEGVWSELPLGTSYNRRCLYAAMRLKCSVSMIRATLEPAYRARNQQTALKSSRKLHSTEEGRALHRERKRQCKKPVG